MTPWKSSEEVDNRRDVVTCLEKCLEPMESTEPTSTCGNAYGRGHYGDFLEAKAKLREEDGRRNQTKCIPVTQFLLSSCGSQLQMSKVISYNFLQSERGEKSEADDSLAFKPHLSLTFTFWFVFAGFLSSIARSRTTWLPIWRSQRSRHTAFGKPMERPARVEPPMSGDSADKRI